MYTTGCSDDDFALHTDEWADEDDFYSSNCKNKETRFFTCYRERRNDWNLSEDDNKFYNDCENKTFWF